MGAPLDGHDAAGTAAADATACALRCGTHVGVGVGQCRGWTFFAPDARQRLRVKLRAGEHHPSHLDAAGIGLCVLKGGSELTAKNMGEGVNSGILKHVYRR